MKKVASSCQKQIPALTAEVDVQGEVCNVLYGRRGKRLVAMGESGLSEMGLSNLLERIRERTHDPFRALRLKV
ncbi:hypothetical protein ACS0TY_010619 [Phlomoides rotata]